MSEQSKWDKRYQTESNSAAAPSRVLHENAHLLPARGDALDLACGRGGNALHLARLGLHTEAWDISPVAIEQLTQHAAKAALSLITHSRDVVEHPPQASSFDVIVVSRFLHRPLCPRLALALRPGGLLFYQTFIHDKLDKEIGPANPDYLLARNELLELFPSLTLVAYREEGCLGDPALGFRNEAYLVAQRQGF